MYTNFKRNGYQIQIILLGLVLVKNLMNTSIANYAKMTVQKHFSKQKHKNTEKSIKNNTKINNIPAYKNATNLNNNTKIAEICLAHFRAQYSFTNIRSSCILL